MKLARKYHSEIGHPERYRSITIEGAFHGRSLAMLAAGRQKKQLHGFGPIVDGFDQVEFGNIDELNRSITSQTAAIMLEPIQGEGGVRLMEKSYLKAVRKLANKHGVLLIVDEVQSGIGRTGKLFAHEHAEIKPDIMALAKGLGGGFPIGACLATNKVAQNMGPGSHGSTFGGNPLATAVGNAVLDIILAEGFLENVNRLSDIFFKNLKGLIEKYPLLFSEVRGAGLMIGLRCKDTVDNGAVVKKLIENGMLAVPAGENVIRLLPPLIIDDSHIDEATKILEVTSEAF